MKSIKTFARLLGITTTLFMFMSPYIKASGTASPSDVETTNQALATFGGGCFWCTEAIFETLDGVHSVESGYMGGHIDNPSYQAVCSGETGHAEVIQVTYDPQKVSYSQLLDLFWKAHDPTQLNRQGADVGTQYRSVIFYHTPEQRTIAEASKRALEDSNPYTQPIVTEIAAASTFYVAEEAHQDYYANNRSAPYCTLVIRPKLEKLGLESPDNESDN